MFKEASLHVFGPDNYIINVATVELIVKYFSINISLIKKLCYPPFRYLRVEGLCLSLQFLI